MDYLPKAENNVYCLPDCRVKSLLSLTQRIKCATNHLLESGEEKSVIVCPIAV